MIPKIIHYCWFGGEKPKKVIECIESWKKCLSDYEIMEWNQNNFNVYEKNYTADAYQAHKYAFVSDVARVKALYDYGGIYLDTDVMVYKNFNNILNHRCVFGFEEEHYISTSFMACEPQHPLMQQFLSIYDDLSFYDENGNIIPGTNVGKLTKILTDMGLVRNNQYQELMDGIAIYPQEYFSPYDYANCIHHNTENTICEHLFYVSWMPRTTRVKKGIKYIMGPLLGKARMDKLRKLKCR